MADSRGTSAESMMTCGALSCGGLVPVNIGLTRREKSDLIAFLRTL